MQETVLGEGKVSLLERDYHFRCAQSVHYKLTRSRKLSAHAARTNPQTHLAVRSLISEGVRERERCHLWVHVKTSMLQTQRGERERESAGFSKQAFQDFTTTDHEGKLLFPVEFRSGRSFLVGR